MRSSFVWAFAAVQVALGTPFPQGVSRTSRCGSDFRLPCQGSSYGNCCSQYGHCGSTSDHCGKGCQPSYGTCNSSPSTPTAPRVSKDGKCVGDSGAVCIGSEYGNCCSQHGWCGQSTGHCGLGCNSLFGTCSESRPSSVSSSRSQSSAATHSSSSTTPSSTLVVSTNARCGNEHGASPKGMTCRGSKYGNCCSSYSYCGSTEDYCGTGCQAGFGNCNAVSSSRGVSSSTSSSSKASSSSSSSTPAPTPSISATISLSSSQVLPSIASSSTVPAQCVATGVICAPGNTCCSGTCSTATFTADPICCNAVGGYCDLNHPEGCCTGACLSAGDGSENGVCF